MAPPAARSPDAPRRASRTTASSQLFSLRFLLPSPFPSPSQLGLKLLAGCVARGLARDSPQSLFMLFAERLDLHIHAGGKIKLHQRVHGLRRGIENIQQ